MIVRRVRGYGDFFTDAATFITGAINGGTTAVQQASPQYQAQQAALAQQRYMLAQQAQTRTLLLGGGAIALGIGLIVLLRRPHPTVVTVAK